MTAAPDTRPRRAHRSVSGWWRRRVTQPAVFLAAGVPMHLGVAAVLGAVAAVLGGSWVFLPVWTLTKVMIDLALPVLALLPLASRLTAAQRRRFQAHLGLRIPAPPEARERVTWHGMRAAARSLPEFGDYLRRTVAGPARSEATWRQLVYHVLAGPAAALGGLTALGVTVAGLALAVVWLPVLLVSFAASTPDHPGKGPAILLFMAPWIVLAMLVGPYLAGAFVRFDIRAATALLGPSRGSLAHRVELLTQSRAGVVDEADAERRRLERDLHDGVQQRLVSLAMNLGVARTSLSGLPDDARKAIEEAHDEAKEAVAELRNLVRGLHPPILEDRGLDAALSGVAARAPLPVRLSVELPERPAPTVEAIAYFVVSEALANIAKHAGASRAEIAVGQAGGRIRVRVTDDGVGGADPSRGTGLAGLARRAASVDGTFQLSSPPGGPTEILVELPCAL